MLIKRVTGPFSRLLVFKPIFGPILIRAFLVTTLLFNSSSFGSSSQEISDIYAMSAPSAIFA